MLRSEPAAQMPRHCARTLELTGGRRRGTACEYPRLSLHQREFPNVTVGALLPGYPGIFITG
eukprot:2654731-Rhodomonas_salina.1